MPNFNDGEKLLVAITKWKASELRLTPDSGFQIQVSGEWRTKIRKLAVEYIHGIMVDLLGEDLANVVSSGKDVQTRYDVPGHGRFIVRANGRKGYTLLSAIPADPSGGPDAE